MIKWLSTNMTLISHSSYFLERTVLNLLLNTLDCMRKTWGSFWRHKHLWSPNTGPRLHHQLTEEGDALCVWEGKQKERTDRQSGRYLQTHRKRTSDIAWRLSKSEEDAGKYRRVQIWSDHILDMFFVIWCEYLVCVSHARISSKLRISTNSSL